MSRCLTWRWQAKRWIWQTIPDVVWITEILLQSMRWIEIAHMRNPRALFTASVVQSLVFVAGGRDIVAGEAHHLSSVEFLDQRQRRWVCLRVVAGSHASVFQGGRFSLTFRPREQGCVRGVVTMSCTPLVASTQQVSAPSLFQSKLEHPLIGCGVGHATRTVEAFDFRAGKWRAGESMIRRRGMTKCAVIDNKVRLVCVF